MASQELKTAQAPVEMQPARKIGDCRLSDCTGRGRLRPGISRIEVVVVVAVSTILLALATPLVLSSREAARRGQCVANLQRLGNALHSYHDHFQQLPPAAVWSTTQMQTLALHMSKRHDLFTRSNWALLVLPYASEEELSRRLDPSLAIAAAQNTGVREARPALMTCPADDYNRLDNPHVFDPVPDLSIKYARGNYAINGGTHAYKFESGSTAVSSGDHCHLLMDRETRDFRFWGNGIAGINQSFSIGDFDNGQSTFVALEEIRAGIHPVDPRGAWALGQIASSITWGHGVNGDDYGPNNLWARSDDILGCARLHELLGKETLERECMPCVWYLDFNQNATARSRHPGGVNVAFLDESVRFIADAIDPGVWHVIHSRETPADVLSNDFGATLAISNVTTEAPTPRPPNGVDAAGVTVEEHSDTVVSNSLGMSFVVVPAGEFTMGLPDVGNGSDTPEDCPPHRVRISIAFRMGAHEVTRSQFDGIMARTAPDGKDGPASGELQVDPDSKLPITGVTWDEALEFCWRLSLLPEERAAGRWYRLPSEAEWEYACRSGKSEAYRWHPQRRQNDSSGEAAGILPPLSVKPVGSYPPNELGLFDMRGNVWEWTADWFDRDYYFRSPVDDPRGPATGFIKVIRGGDWTFVGEGCKINYPMLAPWKSSPTIGFRVVCELAGTRHPESQ